MFNELVEMVKKEIDLLMELDKYIRKLRSAKIRKKDGGRIRDGSVTNYIYLRKLLFDYSRKKKFPLRLVIVRRMSKRLHKSEGLYWSEFHNRFSSYVLDDLKNYDNYLAANFRLFRSFVRAVAEENGIAIAPYINKLFVGKELVPIIVLSPDRLNFLIHNREFDNKLSPALRSSRDIFIVGCAVALRYSDLINLRYADLERVGGGTYLSVRSKKTNTFTRVLLPDHVVQILLRDKRKKNFLFKRIALFNFNANMKKIAFLAGWTEEVQKARSRWGQPVAVYRHASKRKQYRFCDLVSSHMMRKTAITTMLQFGMNENMVRQISGHAAGSAEFYRYVAFSQMYMDQQVRGVYQKLFSAGH